MILGALSAANSHATKIRLMAELLAAKTLLDRSTTPIIFHPHTKMQQATYGLEASNNLGRLGNRDQPEREKRGIPRSGIGVIDRLLKLTVRNRRDILGSEGTMYLRMLGTQKKATNDEFH